jgi:hypothetical protein
MKHLVASFFLVPLAVMAENTNDLSALVPAYGEIPPTFWEQHGTLVVIGLGVFILLLVLILWKRLRPKPVVFISAEQGAHTALAKLRSEPEDGKTLSAISQILRCYVSESFKLPGHEQTTAEFCAAISGHAQLGAEPVNSVSSFLRECDVRKFSPASAAKPMEAVNRALALIEQIEKRKADFSTQTPVTK